MDSRFFRFFYGTVEPALELLAGLLGLFAPAVLRSSLSPGLSADASPAALFVTREFGVMALAFAFVQYGLLRSWERSIVRRLLLALLPGDVIHAALTIAHLAGGGALDAGAAFNLTLSAATPLLRAYFLFVRMERDA
ncbi:hypothetical protein A7982_12935 [Minicystis rosea]|nr:hypothetical protein A7982_12935 [Minicystis rosea]